MDYSDFIISTTKLRKKYTRYSRSSIHNHILFDTNIHFNNYFICNNIDKQINQYINDQTIIEKEKRMTDLFSTINKNAKKDVEQVILSIQKIFIRFSIIPYHEYHWLKKVISITENIPICITISYAKKEYFGFPLVYVNKQFEETTGYNRDEIIGKKCRFLQPKVPIPEEKNQLQIISNCLSFGIPTSVIITNVKKDNTTFHNLISLKPVLDEEQNYLYSIGIQTEITREQVNKIDIQNVIDLIDILSKIKCIQNFEK